MSPAPPLCRSCASIASSSSRRTLFVSATPASGGLRRHTPSSGHTTRRQFSSSSLLRFPRLGDHYGSLKLPKNATKQQIKAKFYELSKKTHPDAPGGSADKFHEINEAYEVLGDESKRRAYDLSLSQSSTTHAGPSQYHNPAPTYTPYSDPYHRRTGPHSGWSTRRPPPKAPPTGFGTYSPYGRHTPFGYGGASSGSYGDPFAHARETFRQGFQDVKSGRPWPQSEMFGSPGARRRNAKKNEAQGGDLGKIVGTFVLVILVVLFGGSLTAHAEQDETEERMCRYAKRYERERIIRTLGRDEDDRP